MPDEEPMRVVILWMEVVEIHGSASAAVDGAGRRGSTEIVAGPQRPSALEDSREAPRERLSQSFGTTRTAGLSPPARSQSQMSLLNSSPFPPRPPDRPHP